MSAWIVGREYDRSLAGEDRIGVQREYLRHIGGALGHLSLTTNQAQAQRFSSRDEAIRARRAAWPRRTRGIRALVQLVDEEPSQ